MADTFSKILDMAMRVRVWEKFKTELGVTSMLTQSAFCPKSQAYRHVMEKQGQNQLPFMNIWRDPVSFDWARNKSQIARHGVASNATQEGDVDEVKAVPVKMNYSVWWWSKDLDALYAIAEKYNFWIHDDPNLDLLLSNQLPLELDLTFGDIVDEGMLDNLYEKGSYYVYRAPITLDGWIFSLSYVKLIKHVIVKGYDYTIDPDGELLFTDTADGVIVEDGLQSTEEVGKE